MRSGLPLSIYPSNHSNPNLTPCAGLGFAQGWSIQCLMTDRTKFIKWYVRPFNRLKGMRHGDAAFVILSMGIALCERYYRTKSGCITAENLNDKFHRVAARQFDCDLKIWKRFWNVYRHGMQHRGQPQRWIMESKGPGLGKRKVRLGWMIDSSFDYRPSVYRSNGRMVICIDPAKFTRFVLTRFLRDPTALRKSLRHQFGSIMPMPVDCRPAVVPYSP